MQITPDFDNAYADPGDVFEHLFRPASDLEGRPIPPRRWLIPDLVPAGTVTLLGGDGGTGKSTLALQLAAATATGGRWLGREIAMPGPAMLATAEDDNSELHRRIAGIANADGLSLADLEHLHLVSLAGADALLAAQLPAKAGLAETPLFRRVEDEAARIGPAVIVLDTVADLFGGNEIDRAQVRQFVGMLRGLAIRTGAAVVLLAHPSVAGMQSGSGLSGSTAWNNSVRSRLYLERIRDEGFEPDPDARRLSVKKSNYAGTATEIMMRWRDGRFVADEPEAGLDRLAADARADRVFLKCLDGFTAEGRTVKSATAAGYAPKVFAASGRAEGLSKQAMAAAMERLFARGAIVEVMGGDGAPSKRTKRIVRTPAEPC
jgi:RecA-family ATPase